MNVEQKKAVLIMLRNTESLYVHISPCTQMPYVECNPDTYDDEVFLFASKEDAENSAKEMAQNNIPVRIAVIDKKNRAPFFVGLYPIGVNGLVVGRGTDREARVQLEELITRTIPKNLPEGKKFVENPQFQITALYIAQEMRKPQHELTEDVKALQEEMMAHFLRGTYLIPVRQEEKKEMPVLKQKDGKAFHPVFTDVQEFGKFAGMHKEEKFDVIVVEAAKLPEILSPEVSGVAVNPMGVNMQLQIAKKKQTN